MDEILQVPIGEMPGMAFACSCGRQHRFSVAHIAIRQNALEALPEMAAPFKGGKLVTVFDSNTYPVAGRRAVALLREQGFTVKELLFDCGGDVLLPDERTLGRILMEIDPEVTLVVAIGSGVINDSVKYVTSRCGLPYIVVATAPSMDGYVSDGAPIICEGYKYSPQAHLTYGLVGDTAALQTAPQDLIQAGYGDVVGKITALADWDLAVKANGDYRCDTCVQLVQQALDKCFAQADGLPTRQPAALEALMEALTITGVAMALLGISRPASGAEHMLSHYWEMEYIARGLNPIHHGIQVGVATVIIARFFEELADCLPEGTGVLCPSHEEIEALLRRGGAPVSPVEIGLDRELFHRSLLESYTVRPRYSVMEYAKAQGWLEMIAEKITAAYYG
ncbi:MAG: sn-glycerol-1-phosphate dehydrogenase [Clostridia bacterium]|nr:sn-glycerol-1-phosphate dehydrogenase [Clostridia bacterium]